MGIVAFVVGALVEVIGAEEGVQALRRMQHVVVGAAGALIVLIVLPRWVELRKLGIQLVVRNSRARQGRAVRDVEWQRWRAFEGRAHNRDRTENIGPDERGPGGDRRAGVVSDYHRDRTVAKRVD